MTVFFLRLITFFIKRKQLQHNFDVAKQSLTNTKAQKTKNRKIQKNTHTNEETQRQHEQQQKNTESNDWYSNINTN